MFGYNEIVGKSYFANAGDKLFVTSRFMTLQGEGPYRGEPAFFIRLAKCNLACTFCDTFFDQGSWFGLNELEEDIYIELSKFFGGHIPNWALIQPRQMVLVITGGEPMLQSNLGNFLWAVENEFRDTQIETNGTVWQELPSSTTLVCSPKCLEKDRKAIKYLHPNEKVLRRANCLKFVMCADADSPYSSVPDWALEWKDLTNNPIFISPMNIYNREPQKSKQLRATKEEISLEERSTVDEVISFWEPGLLDMDANRRNHEYAANYAIRHGCIFNVQIHLLASVA